MKSANRKIEELKIDNRNWFSFKVKRTEIKDQLLNINSFEDSTCKISFQNFLDQTKEIIYIQDYDFNDEFKESVTYEHPCI